MIPRYELKEISSVWSQESKFSYYLKVELALIKALETSGIAKAGTANIIESKVKIDLERLLEIEKEVKHDVIAFCSMITEQLTSDEARFFHYGVTSSDIIDTALSLQIKDSLEIIFKYYDNYLASLESLINRSDDILGIGRSHGIFAEPLIFGQKFLGIYAEAKRNLNHLKFFADSQLRSQFSGAVGNYTVLTHGIEDEASKILGLKKEELSTQVIPRDRIAQIVSSIAITACSLDRLATELRHLQHSDVNEVYEGFSSSQKGSSTMPHKKNPISSENTSGIARILRSHVQVALENIVLWHERDITHSSAERIYLPDTFGLFAYSLKRMTNVLENLVFNKENIESKVKHNTTSLSSFYLHELLSKTSEKREDIYKVLQGISFDCMGSKDLDFFEELEKKYPGVNLTVMNFESLKAHYKNNFKKSKERIFS